MVKESDEELLLTKIIYEKSGDDIFPPCHSGIQLDFLKVLRTFAISGLVLSLALRGSVARFARSVSFSS